MVKVSKNFDTSEFGKNLSKIDSVRLRWLVYGVLQKVRNHFGAVVKPTSFKRDPKKNEKVKGKDTSQHLKAEAVDFIVIGVPSSQVYDFIVHVIGWEGEVFYYEDKPHIHVGLPVFGLKMDRGIIGTNGKLTPK